MNLTIRTHELDSKNKRNACRINYSAMKIVLYDQKDAVFRVRDISSSGIAFASHDSGEKNDFCTKFYKHDIICFDLYIEKFNFLQTVKAKIIHTRENKGVIGCQFDLNSGQQRKLDKFLTIVNKYLVLKDKYQLDSKEVINCKADIERMIRT